MMTLGICSTHFLVHGPPVYASGCTRATPARKPTGRNPTKVRFQGIILANADHQLILHSFTCICASAIRPVDKQAPPPLSPSFDSRVLCTLNYKLHHTLQHHDGKGHNMQVFQRLCQLFIIPGQAAEARGPHVAALQDPTIIHLYRQSCPSIAFKKKILRNTRLSSLS
jgi:hypothetical protein